jgi:hypothetical protein
MEKMIGSLSLECWSIAKNTLLIPSKAKDIAKKRKKRSRVRFQKRRKNNAIVSDAIAIAPSNI